MVKLQCRFRWSEVAFELDHASNLRANSDDVKDYVDYAKRCRCLDVLPIFEVHLLLGLLDDVDHLVRNDGAFVSFCCSILKFPCFVFLHFLRSGGVQS